MGSQVFTTTGADTFNWPSGVTLVQGEVVGGGGGGGAGTGNPSTGGGGKGGGYASAGITKGVEASLAITVGTGGGSVGNGAASSIVQGGVTRVLGTGGGAGSTGSSNNSNGAGGTTQVGTGTGSVVRAGGNGGTGTVGSSSGGGGGAASAVAVGGAASGGTAGSSGGGLFQDGVVYSGGGAAGVASANPGASAPSAGPVYGGGGSGGHANNATDRAGGSGRQGVVVIVWQALAQDRFRFYDDGTESGSTALAAENADISLNLSGSDQPFQVRFRIQGSMLVGNSTDDFQIYVSKNGGAYGAVNGAGDIRIFASANFAEGDATTQRLSAGTGSFSAGKCSEDGEVNDKAIPETGHTEFMYSVKLTGGQGAGGDTYDFRVYRNGFPIDTYTVTPRLTLTSPGGSSVVPVLMAQYRQRL